MTDFIVIDLDGTKIEGVVMSRERAILRRERVATPHAYHEIVRVGTASVPAWRTGNAIWWVK